MYKIVNNNIYITRGETPTYDVKVIDRATGAPFVLPKLGKILISFGVRRSDYIKDGYAIKKYMWVTGGEHENPDFVELDTDTIYTYDPKDTAWSTLYDFNNTDLGEVQPNNIRALFRRKTATGTWEYRANIPTKVVGEVDGAITWVPNWVDYSFTIRFPFEYKDTSTLPPKSYKYSMTIYGGNDLTIEDGKIREDTISYKKPLVDAQFIVEADINE